ncbi:penicillin acylase family protein [Verticiella sediminum]|uniref:Penicillin acylase family protein n=1 Tax=Verticiella sediminum TaxID=1247510 RepID=A0A556AKN8_9BURK|nr:penicillin acylase family protein [Verticiella sediminum]TSH93443.1 penicillin acylase family protein [Verticiella sediminum]
MKWIKRLGWLVLVLVLLAGIAAGIRIWRSLPVLDGAIRAPGLQAAVTVARDEADIAHIFAASPRDAWYALGWTHAQERGWQLETQRRVMRGELSEVLGGATLDLDRLMRTLGIVQAARRQYQGLPAEARAALEAYAQGINDFHANGGQALPPEFLILGVQPGPWLPEDSVGWLLMMALDLGGNWGTEFARLTAAEVLDTGALWELFPPYPGEPPASDVDFASLYRELGVYRNTPAPQSTPSGVAADTGPQRPAASLREPAAQPLLAWARALADSAGNVDGKGSNNWVVAGTRTASGKPLLANDPHLGLGAPALWYFARLHAPGLDVIGASLPGLPFVVLGRTRGAAWGFTNTGPDVQDLYLERIDPGDPDRYRTPDGWAAFTKRTEIIRVRGADPVTHVVRSTRHGPVLSDAQPQHARVLDLSRHVLALRWSALDADNHTALAGLLMNQAQTVAELREAGRYYHSPMQSVVMADSQGNVGFKALGKVPLRGTHNDIRGVAPAPGWEARYDWAGWLPYEDTPQSDVPDGWFATANQRVMPADYPHFLGQDWVVPYRYERIAELLERLPKHDVASMREIQGDIWSPATARLLPFLLDVQSGHPLAAEALAALAGFDGTMGANSPAPLIFAAWADELARGLVGPHLGQARFDMLYGRRSFRATVESTLEGRTPGWCGALDCREHVREAFERALDRLRNRYGGSVDEWRWGEAHVAISSHRPFGNVPPLDRVFDVRVPTGGDSYTVNVGQYNLADGEPFANRHAASLRAIYDLGDPDASLFIYQTGQSGVVFSSRYRDMRDEWAALEYRPLRLREPPRADRPGWAGHVLQLRP